MMRLQKLLAQAGVASRRQAEELIADGSVSVNGQVVTTLGIQVEERRDRVEVHGRRVMVEDPLYRILLKPRQCLSSLSRPSADKDVSPEGPRPTLARYVSDRELGWQVVAPLDFLSEGVILLTTDGALAERMSRGGGRIPMTYHLKFQGALGESEMSRLTRGWSFNGRPVRPSKVEALATTGKNTWIEMVVPESRPRALKAAGEAIHHQLLKISRVRLGELSFEGLKMGGWRDLSNSEIKGLRGSQEGNPGRAPEPARALAPEDESDLRQRDHGNPGRGPKPSRAPAPYGKADLRQRDHGNPGRGPKPSRAPASYGKADLRQRDHGNPGRGPKPSRAPAPYGKADLRQRDHGNPGRGPKPSRAPAGKARLRSRDR